MGPTDKAAHEEYLDFLIAGSFDAVLVVVGELFGLFKLVVYQVAVVGASRVDCVNNPLRCWTETGTYHPVIISLALREGIGPQLPVTSGPYTGQRFDALKHQLSTVSVLGNITIYCN